MQKSIYIAHICVEIMYHRDHGEGRIVDQMV